MLLGGKLDDQDRVLAQQSYEHDEPYLSINIIVQSHALQQEERAHDTDRQREDHRQRQQETLILPDQHEIDEHQHDDEDVNGFIAAKRLVEGEARPSDVKAARKGLGCHLLNGLDGVARAESIGGRTLNRGCGIGIVTGDFVESQLGLHRNERRVRNHLAFVVTDVEVVEILGKPSKLRISLDVELEELTKLDEALLVSATNEDREIVHGLANGNALLHGSLVVDDQLDLRVVGAEEGEEAP